MEQTDYEKKCLVHATQNSKQLKVNELLASRFFTWTIFKVYLAVSNWTHEEKSHVKED